MLHAPLPFANLLSPWTHMAWHLCPVTEDFYMLGGGGGGGGAEPNLPWGDDDEYYSRATQATVEQKQAICMYCA